MNCSYLVKLSWCVQFVHRFWYSRWWGMQYLLYSNSIWWVHYMCSKNSHNTSALCSTSVGFINLLFFLKVITSAPVHRQMYVVIWRNKSFWTMHMSTVIIYPREKCGTGAGWGKYKGKNRSRGSLRRLSYQSETGWTWYDVIENNYESFFFNWCIFNFFKYRQICSTSGNRNGNCQVFAIATGQFCLLSCWLMVGTLALPSSFPIPFQNFQKAIQQPLGISQQLSCTLSAVPSSCPIAFKSISLKL